MYAYMYDRLQRCMQLEMLAKHNSKYQEFFLTAVNTKILNETL